MPFSDCDRKSSEDKVCCYLKRLASGTTYRELGYEFDMSGAYVGRVCTKVGSLICSELGPEQVRLPTQSEAIDIAAVFKERFGIDYCCGAIDGTHVRFRYAHIHVFMHAVSLLYCVLACANLFIYAIYFVARCHTDVKEAHWSFKGFHSFHIHALVDNEYAATPTTRTRNVEPAQS